jgi:hypothetical protein
VEIDPNEFDAMETVSPAQLIDPALITASGFGRMIIAFEIESLHWPGPPARAMNLRKYFRLVVLELFTNAWYKPELGWLMVENP